MTKKWSRGAGKLTRGAKSTEDRSMRLTMYPGSSSAERPRFERCSRSISQGIPGCFEGDKFFRSRIMTLQESIHISRVVRGYFANRLVLEATGFLFHFSNTLKCLRGNKASKTHCQFCEQRSNDLEKQCLESLLLLFPVHD